MNQYRNGRIDAAIDLIREIAMDAAITAALDIIDEELSLEECEAEIAATPAMTPPATAEDEQRESMRQSVAFMVKDGGGAGRMIRQLIDSYELTQRELGQILGVSQRLISYAVNGRPWPTIHMALLNFAGLR